MNKLVVSASKKQMYDPLTNDHSFLSFLFRGIVKYSNCTHYSFCLVPHAKKVIADMMQARAGRYNIERIDQQKKI